MKLNLLLVLLGYYLQPAPVFCQIWDRLPRLCQQIAARDDQIFCKTDDNQLWKWVSGIHDWIWVQQYIIKPIHVSVGFDESIWVVTMTNDLFRFTNNTWAQVNATFNGTATKLLQISALNDHEAIGITINDTIIHFTNETWNEFYSYGERAAWVSVGRDGTIWSVSKKPEVLQWDGDYWNVMEQAIGANIKYVDAYNIDRVVATDEQRRLHLWINKDENWLYTPVKGPAWQELQNPYPNCQQAVITKKHIFCVSDQGFINKSTE